MLHTQKVSKRLAARVALRASLLPLTLLVLLFAVATATAQTATPKYPEPPPSDPFKARLIPRNSKVYIAPMISEDATKPQAQGFESYLAAALRKKDVPLLIVADRSEANPWRF